MDVFSLLKYMVDEEHKAIDALLEKIDDDDLKVKLHDKTEETIGDRFNHLLGAEFRMATYLHQEDSDPEKYETSATSVADLRKLSEKSARRHKVTLDNLTEADLEKVWTSKVSGNSYDYKFLLWHFIEHLATHRGQISMIINKIKN